MNHKHLLALLALIMALVTSCLPKHPIENGYMRVAGKYLLTAEGDTFFIRGTNLGNWMNPEGYMFGFRRVNSPRMIQEVFNQLIGPAEADRFWAEWKDRYITEADIRYIAQTGANTIRPTLLSVLRSPTMLQSIKHSLPCLTVASSNIAKSIQPIFAPCN